jgi:Ca2+-binding EF-hand superfamily protein
MDSKDTLTLDSIDQLFQVLDTNNDGILSYRECFDGMSNSQVQTIINNSGGQGLSDMLHPNKLKSTMKKIAKHHPSGELNRGAFRLWVQMSRV